MKYINFLNKILIYTNINQIIKYINYQSQIIRNCKNKILIKLVKDIDLKQSEKIAYGVYNTKNSETVFYYKILFIKFFISCKNLFGNKKEIKLNKSYYLLSKVLNFKFEGFIPIDLLIRDLIQIHLLQYNNSVLLHTSCIKIENNIICIYGLSGIGKSNFILKILKLIKCELINDDIIVISNKQVSSYSKYKDERKFKKLGVLDYLLLSYSLKKIEISRFYGSYCENSSYEQIYNFFLTDGSAGKIEKIDLNLALNKIYSLNNINFINNNLINKYIYASNEYKEFENLKINQKKILKKVMSKSTSFNIDLNINSKKLIKILQNVNN